MQLLLSLLFVLPGMAFAQPQDNTSCQDRVERGGSIQVQMRPTSSGSCFVSVSNFKGNSMVYRGYVFAEDGNLMVFNSFGAGPISESTGAREFYTFPRRFQNPTFKWNDEVRRLEVTSTVGDEYYFDYETAQLSGMNKAEVQVSPEVSPHNDGGVEIRNYQGLMLDAGFKRGSAPTGNPKAKAKFIDAVGTSCSILIGDVFSYSPDGDPYIKYSDKNLTKYLKAKCPKLKFPGT